jgi:peptidoglycan hydrolase-like protein with peptidoglycan-binding domain
MQVRPGVVLVIALSLGVAACGDAASRAGTVTDVTRRTTTTSSSSTTTTTVAPSTTTAAPAAAPAGLGVGASGAAVSALQQRLIDLRYDLPEVNGTFGPATQQAVYAFQKVNGMARTGRATDDVLARLASAGVPPLMVPGASGTHVEIDVARQVLFFVKGGSLFKIVPVSTGSGQRFCVKGDCSTAVTPGGSYHVYGKYRGWQTGNLGKLYSPSYFNGGIAVHGATSVPPYPASHGCARVPMTSADWLFASMPVGMPVYVLNGPRVPAPFSEETTTTTVAPTTTTAAPTTTSSSTTTSTSTTTSSTSTTTTTVP